MPVQLRNPMMLTIKALSKADMHPLSAVAPRMRGVTHWGITWQGAN
jgi:hypothetical protein